MCIFYRKYDIDWVQKLPERQRACKQYKKMAAVCLATMTTRRTVLCFFTLLACASSVAKFLYLLHIYFRLLSTKRVRLLWRRCTRLRSPYLYSLCHKYVLCKAIALQDLEWFRPIWNSKPRIFNRLLKKQEKIKWNVK